MVGRWVSITRPVLFVALVLAGLIVLAVVWVPAIDAQQPSSASFAIGDREYEEAGSSGTAIIRFAVTRSGDMSQPFSVNFRSDDVTATGTAADQNACTTGADYARPQTSGGGLGRLDFAPNQTTAEIELTVCDDNIDEFEETFQVVLVDTVPAGGTFTRAVATGRIVDNDAAPTVRIGNATVPEGNNVARLVVTLSAASGKDITFSFATANGTARGAATCGANVDYISATGTNLTIPRGTTGPLNIDVRACPDAVDEIDETFVVNLTNTNANNATARGTGTIIDDDAQPTVRIDDAVVQEGDAQVNIRFTLTLSTASGRNVAANYATALNGGAVAATPSPDATCSPGEDFLTRSNVARFVVNPNTGRTPTTVSVDVPICGDLLDENNEMFQVRLDNVTGATLVDGNARGTINDNDPLPRLVFSSQRVNEGDPGINRPAVMVATLRDANNNLITSGRPVSFTARTIPGTDTATTDVAQGGADCNTDGVDHINVANRSEVIGPGSNREIMVTTVCGDGDIERGETYGVVIENVVNAVAPTGNRTITILNDDGPTLSINDVRTGEGNVITFTVTLSGASKQPVRVQFATANDTARTGTLFASTECETLTGNRLPNDYARRVTTIEFPSILAIRQTKEIAVRTCHDSQFEFDETFFAVLDNAEFGEIVDNRGIGTIVNDDPCDPEANTCNTGVPSLTPQNAIVGVGERLHYRFTWTVPQDTGRVWRDLKSMELRLRDGDEFPLWLRWDEAANTFCLIDPFTGACGPAQKPGSSSVLQYGDARLYLAQTTVQGSGPTGPSVTLGLSLSFDPGLEGKTLAVEVSAEDDFQNQDLFTRAGSLRVLAEGEKVPVYLPLVLR